MGALRGADMTGKTVVVTGGNSGLGVETARTLAYAGAKVIITSRSLAAGQTVADELNAAGLKIGTNHFGHFELTRLLLDKLQKQESHVRIVCLSSSAHQMGGLDLQDLHLRTRKYGAWKAHGRSKLCNILFVYELARRTQGTNIEAFALHPGVIATALWRYGCMNKMMQRVQAVLGMTKTVEQGAATTIYAATAPELAGKSGVYLDNCKIATPYKPAQTANELAKELWTVTEQQLRDAAAKLQS